MISSNLQIHTTTHTRTKWKINSRNRHVLSKRAKLLVENNQTGMDMKTKRRPDKIYLLPILRLTEELKP